MKKEKNDLGLHPYAEERDKMTQVEFLNAVVTMASVDEEANKEMIEHAYAEIQKIADKNAKAAEKRAEKSKENAPLYEKLLSLITEEPQTASTLKDAMEISVQKCSAMLRKLVAEEKIQVKDIKVAKKGVQKAYFI